MTRDALWDMVDRVAKVVEVSIGTDRTTGRSKGYGFVELSTPEETQRAQAHFHEFEMDGRCVSHVYIFPSITSTRRG